MQELRAQGQSLLEFNALRKDGSCFPVEASLRYITVANQSYIIGIVRNITERKNAENKLKDRLDELERFSKVTVKRELRMGEIKAENEKLKQKIQELENRLSNV